MTRRRKRRRPIQVSRKVLGVLGLAVGAFVLGYALVALLLFPGGGSQDVVTVPDVRGRDQKAAIRELEAIGLEVELGSALEHPQAPVGSILAQSPLPGQEVSPGSIVTVTVSAGRERREVPDVNGMARAPATRLLERSGFKVELREAAHSTPAGRVLETRPAGGTPVEPGSLVRLLVSKGPPRVAVPDILGMTEAEALPVLERSELKLGEVSLDFGSFQPYGRIVAQRPHAGDSLRVGSPVHVVVSGNRGGDVYDPQ